MIEPIDVSEFFIPFGPVPVVHENGVSVSPDQPAPGRQPDALPFIGRVGLAPEDPRDDTEHGAAIEGEMARFDRVDGVWSDLHACSTTKKVGSVPPSTAMGASPTF